MRILSYLRNIAQIFDHFTTNVNFREVDLLKVIINYENNQF
jgi:hypothetical protein